MTIQKCWMYGVTKKSKEETTLSGEALKEHSRIVHECIEFMKRAILESAQLCE